MTPAEAVARYAAVGARLPDAPFASTRGMVEHLGDLLDQFDVFVLDGFGVLNVGHSAVPQAAERVHQLRAAGKRVLVLTNGATFPVEVTWQKYEKWGFGFSKEDIVSSRDGLREGIAADYAQLSLGVMGVEESQVHRLSRQAHLLGEDPDDFHRAEVFVLLGTRDWTDSQQCLLEQALRKRPRPVLVGNPDLVAPFEERLSLEPGAFAHALADGQLAAPVFYGKPFQNVFDIVKRRLGDGHDPARIAMVGDTLHTDILGGAAAGWGTVLVEQHGLMRTLDVEHEITLAGVVPDWRARMT